MGPRSEIRTRTRGAGPHDRKRNYPNSRRRRTRYHNNLRRQGQGKTNRGQGMDKPFETSSRCA